MKKLLALGVIVVILIISTSIYSILKIMLENSNFGFVMYENYGKLGAFIHAIIELAPLIVGVWLIRFSWKKITIKKEEK
jgi:hypothetical protein